MLLFIVILSLSVIMPVPVFGAEQDSQRFHFSALEKIGIKSCDDAENLIKKADKDIIDYVPLSYIYDMDVCGFGDKDKAIHAYKNLVESKEIRPFYPIGNLRLGHFYHQTNPEKSTYHFRQFLIQFSPLNNANLIEDIILKFFAELSIPNGKEVIAPHLTWFRSILKKDEEERRKIALELAKDGYNDTPFLYGETIPIENIPGFDDEYLE